MIFKEKMNIGRTSNEIVQVDDLVSVMTRKWDKGKCEVRRRINQENQTSPFLLGSCKAMNLLEWVPKYRIEKAVRKTVEWYKEFNNNSDINIFTEKQIKEYFEGE